MSEPQEQKALEYLPYSVPTIGSAGRTGSWRSVRPLIDQSRCNKCDLCWLYCPDGTISRTRDNVPSIDLVYCKGCGICAAECPLKAIAMIDEEGDR